MSGIRDTDRARALRAGGGTVADTRRARRGAAHEAVLAEIKEETAGSLGRAGRKIEAALAAAHEAREALEAHQGDDTERAALLATYKERRAAAVRARWEMKVHREAIGLRSHDDLDELYPLPPRLS